MVKLPALGSCPGLPSCNDETLCPDHRDIMRWQEALVCEVAQWKSSAETAWVHAKDVAKRLDVANLQLQEAKKHAKDFALQLTSIYDVLTLYAPKAGEVWDSSYVAISKNSPAMKDLNEAVGRAKEYSRTEYMKEVIK